MDNKQDLSGLLGLLKCSDKNTKQQAAQQMISSLDSAQQQELKSLIGDKDKINEVLNSPAAAQIIKKLSGNGNGQHK